MWLISFGWIDNINNGGLHSTACVPHSFDSLVKCAFTTPSLGLAETYFQPLYACAFLIHHKIIAPTTGMEGILQHVLVVLGAIMLSVCLSN